MRTVSIRDLGVTYEYVVCRACGTRCYPGSLKQDRLCEECRVGKEVSGRVQHDGEFKTMPAEKK